MTDGVASYIRRQISLGPLQVKSRIHDKEGERLENRFLYHRILKYVDGFLDGENTGSRWICIPGFRGTGKTTLLSQVFDHLSNERNVPENNLLYISLDEVSKLLESSLYELMGEYQKYRGISLEGTEEKIFIFADEVHYDEKWDVTIKTMVDRTESVFFLVTGSSAVSLQTGSDSARRITIRKLLPMTFRESLKIGKGFGKYLRPDIELEELLFFSEGPVELINGLKEKRKDFHDFWNGLDPYSLDEYLLTGSMPFSNRFSREQEVYEKTLQVLDKVIYDDISRIDNYNTSTLDKIWALIHILSSSREISLDSLANKLDLGKPTVHKIMTTLERSEIIFQVKAYGSVSKQVTKSPKYPFISPLIRASLKWKMGGITDRNSSMGELLEDSVGFYLKKLCDEHPYLHLHHPPGKGEADYVLTDDRNERGIVIEVGYGDDKGTKQVKKSMKHIPTRYALVISDREYIDLIENIVFVPMRYFFTI